MNLTDIDDVISLTIDELDEFIAIHEHEIQIGFTVDQFGKRQSINKNSHLNVIKTLRLAKTLSTT